MRCLTELDIKRPRGHTVMTTEEALAAAEELGYPVLLRPSYVLGGQNMIIAFQPEDVREYMAIILAQGIENPILIDQYLMGTELEVDAISDGTHVLIPGMMEHIERAGVHSGDSIAVYPAWNVDDEMLERIVDCSTRLALSLKVQGLVNIQYLIYGGELYVIEVNPRSSRTDPVYQQGHRRADGGSRHACDARRKAARDGFRRRALPDPAVRGGKGAGVLL